MIYLTIKLVHVTCVAISGGLFGYRFIQILKLGKISQIWLKMLPHAIDTLLLISAIYLCIASTQYPWSVAWLASKLWGLLLYIGFGLLALRFCKAPSMRLATGTCALLSYGYIIGVALNRSSLSWLSLL